MPDFDKLAEHVAKLNLLLADQQIGLISWTHAVGLHWSAIAEMWKPEDSLRDAAPDLLKALRDLCVLSEPPYRSVDQVAAVQAARHAIAKAEAVVSDVQIDEQEWQTAKALKTPASYRPREDGLEVAEEREEQLGKLLEDAHVVWQGILDLYNPALKHLTILRGRAAILKVEEGK